MLNYILNRIKWIFIILFAILSASYILMSLLPVADPIETEVSAIADYYSSEVKKGRLIFLDDVCNFEEEMDRASSNCYKSAPLMDNYLGWLKGVVTEFDWGESNTIKLSEPAFSILTDRLGVTMKLNIIALFIFVPVGFVLGIIAALKKNKPTDNIIMTSVMVVRSIPSFVLMIILLYFLGFQWGLLPTKFPSISAPNSAKILGYFIPVIALSAGPIAGISRMVRNELSESLTSDFLLLARTKGLTHRQATLRHAMRNSAVPMVPMIIGFFTSILSGSLIIETIYGIPGSGGLILSAIQLRDFNVAMVTMAFYTSITLVSVLAADILYGIVDPRIRVGRKR